MSNEERIATLEQDNKSIHRRLGDLETLTQSVHVIATELKETRTDMTEVKTRLTDIEKRPMKWYDTIIASVIALIIGAVGGAMMVKMGLK